MRGAINLDLTTDRSGDDYSLLWADIFSSGVTDEGKGGESPPVAS